MEKLFFKLIKKQKVIKMQLKKLIEGELFKLLIIKNIRLVQQLLKKKLEMFLRVVMRKIM